MTFFWCIVWMILLITACAAFYVDGYRNGKQDGYKKARAYEDGYKGEWSV